MIEYFIAHFMPYFPTCVGLLLCCSGVLPQVMYNNVHVHCVDSMIL